MFRILLILVLISILFWIFQKIRRKSLSVTAVMKKIKDELLIFREMKDLKEVKVFDRLRKVSYLSTLVLFLLMATTAYLQVVLFGSPLTGWLLIIHVMIAPLFAISLMLTILVWVHRLRFNRGDWLNLQQLMQRNEQGSTGTERIEFFNKINFWIFMLAALPAILSIILQLYPLVDSEGMKWLLDIHRYSTLILFVIVINHFRLVIRGLNNNQ